MNNNDHCHWCPFETATNCPTCPHQGRTIEDDNNEPPTLPLW